jgi:non-ribosomal peptide synthetase component F/thioester reductase-like protein
MTEPKPSALHLSTNEQALWLETRLNPGFPGHLLVLCFELAPEPQAGQLDAALARLSARHPRLSMCVGDSGHGPVFMPAAAPLPERVRVDTLPDPAALADLAFEPLDIGSAPLLRWRRIESASGAVRHVLTAHHLLGDQRSLSALCAELQAELAADGTPTPSASSRHRSARSQTSTPPPRAALASESAQQQDVWRIAQRSAALIADYPQARPSGFGLSFGHRLSTAQAEQLQARARAEGLSRFELLLAAYANALDELYGAQSRLLWIPALEAGGSERYDVRSFPLMLSPDDARPEALTRQVRARGAAAPPLAWDGQPRHAVLHSRAPGGLDPAYAALGAPIDGLQIRSPVTGAPTLRVHALPLQPAAFASCAQVLSLGDDLQLLVQLDRALFEDETARLLVQTWLRHVLDEPLPALAGCSEPEHRARRAEGPSPTLSELLREACQRHASSIALDDGRRCWRYEELLDHAQSMRLPPGALRVDNAPGAAQCLQVFAGLLRGHALRLSDIDAEPSPDCAVQLGTSGSTGAAAVIELPASALCAYAQTMRDQLGLRPGDRLLRFASISFDAALEELLISWLSGATVVCALDSDDQVIEARHLPFGQVRQQLIDLRISALNVGTAWFQATIREGLQLPPAVRQLVIGGEPCDAALWNACRARHPGLDLVNTYGLTEACISQTLFRGEVAPGSAQVPLGWPLAHVELELLVPGGLQPAPRLGEAELCIAGAALGRSMRRSQFIEHSGRRLLRSGDRVRRDARGCLHFLGRLDHVHKYRGRRVCLDTLQRQASAAQDSETCVLLRGENSDAQLWIAYRGEPQSALRALALHSGARLHRQEDWPRLASGKTDRRALADALGAMLAPSPPSTVDSAAGRMLETLAGTAWPPQARVFEVLDSLGWLRLRSRLESEHGLRLAREEFELSRLQIEARLGECPASPPTPQIPSNAPALLRGFLRQIELRPEASALIAGDLRLDYASLYAQVRTLQTRLEEAGVGAADRVAFHATREPFDVLAMLAIGLAGAAFVPLDSPIESTQSRQRCRQAGARFALAPERIVELKEITSPEALPDLAYVLFTSGSSGAPKAVAVTHSAAANTVDAVAEKIHLGPNDRLLALSPTRFDLTIFDVFGGLGAGACVVWPNEAQRSEPAAWPALLDLHAVSVWNSVPSALDLLLALESAADPFPGLRTLLLSGDFVSQGLRERAARQLPDARLLVLGGATEAGIWSCAIDAAHCTGGYAPYGPALPGQRLWLQSGAGAAAEAGEIGEICIGGASLALGYLDDGALALRFDPHYATGDLGRQREHGCIEILGRADQLAKWRGRRVSVADLEARLLENPGVRAACVLSVDSSLHALLQLDAGVEFEAIRESLQTLPIDSPIPDSWHLRTTMPLGANGKLDRLRLRMELLQSLEADTRELLPAAVSGSNVDDSQTQADCRAWALWQQLLPAPIPTHGPDWRAQGGHSLLALHLVEAAQAQGAARANLAEFLARPAPATVSAWFDETPAPLPDPAPACRRFSTDLMHRLRETRGATLITGATGMLGGALADRFREQRPLLLATRAPDEEAACARLPGFERTQALVLPVDIEQPQLGLDDDSYRALIGAVSEVWHIAAEVNFLLPASALQASNVEGSANVFELARQARAPLHFASTLGVFPYALDCDVDEFSSPDARTLFASGYAESKWRAEQCLQSLSKRAGSDSSPLHVYRLGLIAGPTLRDQDILGIGAQALAAAGSWPQLDLKADVLSLDDAVTAMLMLAEQPPATWHLQNPCVVNLLDAHAALRPQWPLQTLSDWLMQLDATPARSPQAALSRELLRVLIPALPRDAGKGHIRADRTLAALAAKGWRPRSSLEVLQGLLAD